jgi:hypothetical protein
MFAVWLRTDMAIALVLGKTPTGRSTLRALSLDSDFDALEVRSYWVQAGWHPPKD